jgi:adenylate cyclase
MSPRSSSIEAQPAPNGGWADRLKRRAITLAELGTSRYPPKTRRRLRNINVACYAIAVSCALFALTFWLEDPVLYRGAVIVNLEMMVAMLLVPFVHRFHEIAGALFIAIILMAGLFGIVSLVGRDAGVQINFIAASVLTFITLELRRLAYIVFIILAAIILHVVAWVLFPEGSVGSSARDAFLLQLYITTVVTISIIVAVAVYYAFWTAEHAEAETETLLHRILPVPVAERLKARPDEPISDNFSEAAVLFSDLVGFVAIARSLGAARTVEMLNRLVQRFDRLAAECGVEKIKTIGDAYMAAAIGGNTAAENATRLACMALRMQAAADATGAEFGVDLQLRTGMALGPVMAGVIGSQRFGYDVWGDPVNLAARLENAGAPKRIHVSAAFRDALAETFIFEPRGAIEVKGVGQEETWFLLGETGRNDPVGNRGDSG